MMTGEEVKWFVGFVKSCQEKKVAAALDSLGIAHYLPVIREKRKWSDRTKVVDRIVIPGIIFVRCAESARRSSLGAIPALYAYMNDGGPGHPAVVPDRQMQDFIFMVERGGRDVTLTTEGFTPGDRVRITAGPLKGLECELVDILGRRSIAVRLGLLGAATVELMADSIEKIQTENIQ